METASLISKPWKRRSGYNRSSPKHRRTLKVARLGAEQKRSWRLRLAPKLRLLKVATSPVKLWYKLKNAYVNMMLRLSGSDNAFGTKRVPKARDSDMGYSRNEFENRLVFEIYKSMVSSYELGYAK